MGNPLGEEFERILQCYKMLEPQILALPANVLATDRYFLQEFFRKTPIEETIWEYIRDINAVFYPQYPVDKYFADFGNPVARVAIECDGAQFHKDVAKDRARDDVFRSLGWTVYRIPGHMCVSDSPDEGVQDSDEEPYISKMITAISAKHKVIRNRLDFEPLDEKMEAYLDYAERGLLGVMGRFD